MLGFGFRQDGSFHHDKVPATRNGTLRRLRAEIDQVKQDATRTTLRVVEVRVGRDEFRPDDVMAKPESWWHANITKAVFTAQPTAGDPVPLQPMKRMLFPKGRAGADPVQVTMRRHTDGFVRFQVQQRPENVLLFAKALSGGWDATEQDSLFFLEHRLNVLRALRNDRAAPELEKPRELPRLTRPVRRHADLLQAMPDWGLGVIVGPPGTGKTQAISDLALQAEREGKSCLLLSWTRIAVEEGLERVVARGGRARRIGRSASPDVPPTAWDDDVDWLKIAAGEEGLPLFGDRVGEPGIIGATFLQAFVRFNAEHTFDDDKRFDLVLVDEASQAPFEAVLFAMMAGKRVVLLGDPIQLPPVFRADERLDAGTRREAEDCLSSVLHQRPDLYVLLATQYRSLPGIMDWSSRSFYGGMLRNGRVDDGKALSFNRRRLPRIELIVVDGEGPNNRDNPYTLAKAKSRLASAARQLPGLDLPLRGLYITPYKDQAIKAEEALKTVGMDLTIGTVDASQGKQAPIVVFDLCTPKETRFWETATMARRFNVAMTRATHHVVLVVPSGLMHGARIPWLRSLLDYAQRATK